MVDPTISLGVTLAVETENAVRLVGYSLNNVRRVAIARRYRRHPSDVVSSRTPSASAARSSSAGRGAARRTVLRYGGWCMERLRWSSGEPFWVAVPGR